MPRAMRTAVSAPALVAGLAVLLVGAPALGQDATATTDSTAPYDLDWSVGLRGAYSTSTTSGADFEGTVAPAFTFTRHGELGDSSVTGDGAFSVDANRNFSIDTLHTGATTVVNADEWTTLNGSIDLTLNQLKNTDTTLPAGTEKGPLEFTGTATGGATRKFGMFDLTGTLKGRRFIEGPTTGAGGVPIDNTDQNYWGAEGDLRLGYEVTPLVSVFTEADRGYQKFDIADPTLLVFLDNNVTTLRGGISYNHDSTFSGEISAGRFFLDYADPTLTDTAGWVVDGKVSFAPDETLSLDGDLTTTISPSQTAGDTDVDYALTGTARYMVNPWLTLRGTAGVDDTITLETGDSDLIYSAGVGLDVQTSRHTVWSADYAFSREEITGSPADDTHTVTVGVTFKR